MIVTLMCAEAHEVLMEKRGTVYSYRFVTAPSKLQPIIVSQTGELVLQCEKKANFEVGKEYDVTVGIDGMVGKA